MWFTWRCRRKKKKVKSWNPTHVTTCAENPIACLNTPSAECFLSSTASGDGEKATPTQRNCSAAPPRGRHRRGWDRSRETWSCQRKKTLKINLLFFFFPSSTCALKECSEIPELWQGDTVRLPQGGKNTEIQGRGIPAHALCAAGSAAGFVAVLVKLGLLVPSPVISVEGVLQLLVKIWVRPHCTKLITKPGVFFLFC